MLNFIEELINHVYILPDKLNQRRQKNSIINQLKLLLHFKVNIDSTYFM